MPGTIYIYLATGAFNRSSRPGIQNKQIIGPKQGHAFQKERCTVEKDATRTHLKAGLGEVDSVGAGIFSKQEMTRVDLGVHAGQLSTSHTSFWNSTKVAAPL